MTIIEMPDTTAALHEQARAYHAAMADLDAWDDELTSFNVALVDAAVARDRLTETVRLLEVEEARVVLGAVGGNAETRKAAVTLALNEECPAYQTLLMQSREGRLKLADAERRAELARQRCRLLREAVRLQAGGADQ